MSLPQPTEPTPPRSPMLSPSGRGRGMRGRGMRGTARAPATPESAEVAAPPAAVSPPPVSLLTTTGLKKPPVGGKSPRMARSGDTLPQRPVSTYGATSRPLAASSGGSRGRGRGRPGSQGPPPTGSPKAGMSNTIGPSRAKKPRKLAASMFDGPQVVKNRKPVVTAMSLKKDQQEKMAQADLAAMVAKADNMMPRKPAVGTVNVEKLKRQRAKAERLRSKAEDEKDALIEFVGDIYRTLGSLAGDQSLSADALRAKVTELHDKILSKDAELALELAEEEPSTVVLAAPDIRISAAARSLPPPPTVKKSARHRTRQITNTFRQDSFDELKAINATRADMRAMIHTAMQQAATPAAAVDNATAPEDQRARQRENCVRELLETEVQFEKDCQEIIVHTFKASLCTEMRPEDIKAVFSNVDDIVHFTGGFCEALKEECAVPAANQMIGKLFLTNMEKFYVFTQYCVNQPRSAARVKALQKKSSSFKAAVEQANGKLSSKGLHLEDYLIKPVQRVCKYPLLLREIVKATDKSHPDYANIVEAQAKMEQVLTGINATKANSENNQKIAEIEKKFDGEDASRTFIAEGGMKKVVFSPGVGLDPVTGRVLLLFNDILIVAKYQGKKLIMVTVFPVEHCLVWDVKGKGVKQNFQVVRTDKQQSLVVTCDSEKSKDKWMHYINTAISDSFGDW